MKLALIIAISALAFGCGEYDENGYAVQDPTQESINTSSQVDTRTIDTVTASPDPITGVEAVVANSACKQAQALTAACEAIPHADCGKERDNEREACYSPPRGPIYWGPPLPGLPH